jgi:hypothetical protein
VIPLVIDSGRVLVLDVGAETESDIRRALAAVSTGPIIDSSRLHLPNTLLLDSFAMAWDGLGRLEDHQLTQLTSSLRSKDSLTMAHPVSGLGARANWSAQSTSNSHPRDRITIPPDSPPRRRTRVRRSTPTRTRWSRGWTSCSSRGSGG